MSPVVYRLVPFLVSCVLLAACGNDSEVISSGSTASGQTSTSVLGIDGDALLAEYGFVRCDALMPHPDLTDERRNEIYGAVVDAGLGDSAALDPGHRVWLYLFVLDQSTLSELATIADPSEVCLSGQDPNDYVATGPQPLEGSGWRWIGAAGTETDERFGLITTQAGYDAMWEAFTATDSPVDGLQPVVDFGREAVLTLTTGGSGVNVGGCGIRFDGFNVVDDAVVIDWFQPGGDTSCDGAYNFGTYAVALNLDEVGQPPLRVAVRTGPRAEPSLTVGVSPGDGVLGWPLAVLLRDALSVLDSPPTSTELADSVECRLFRQFSDIEIVAGPDIPAELDQATRRYVDAVETLLAETDATAIPRESQLGQLQWIVGSPDPNLNCGPGDTTPSTQPPIQETTTTTIPLAPPTAGSEPDSAVAAGTEVPTRFSDRLTPKGAIYDIGVPSEWETGPSGADFAVVSLTGRGGLEISTHPIDDDAWKTKVSREPEESVLDGPSRLSVPIIEMSGTERIASGTNLVAHQYLYESGPIRRRAVRWYEVGDHVVVVTLLYPDIPEGLGGEDADDILNDIHFFSTTAN